LRRSSRLKALEGVEGLASDNVFCDSMCSDETSSGFDSYPEEVSVLKRQRGFRRRHRTVYRSAPASDCYLLKIPDRIRNKFPGLTLPDGIPSPFSPQDTGGSWPHISVPNDSKSCGISCHLVGLPKTNSLQTSSSQDIFKRSSDIITRLSGTVSCPDVPQRFGLTLSKGLPSPPSPSNGDDDQYCSSVGIAGIQPLSTSPVPPASSSLVMCTRKKGTADGNGSTSSDDTWDSHNHHFMKTPRLTDGHLLKGAEPGRGDGHMEDEGLHTSSGNVIVKCCFTLIIRNTQIHCAGRM
jgi:hypothetical protein